MALSDAAQQRRHFSTRQKMSEWKQAMIEASRLLLVERLKTIPRVEQQWEEVEQDDADVVQDFVDTHPNNLED